MKSDSPKKPITSVKQSTETKLSQLNKGLLVLNIKKEVEEPGYAPIGLITKNRSVVSRRQEYCGDLQRTIDEAKLNTYLLSEVKDEIKVGDRVYQPEETINYYNGVFLDQVHQIKDKLFRMVDRILLMPEQSQDDQKKDPREIKLGKFLSKNKEILEKIGIYQLLEQWSVGNLKIVLDKRTNHHHRVSSLKLNHDFQNVQMSRLMLGPFNVDKLSEYGKKRMTELGQESFVKWKDETVLKQESTIKEIDENIESISERLIKHFMIPTKPEDIASIINEYTKYLSSFDIKNQAASKKIPKEISKILEGLIKIAAESFGDQLASIYLVGSVGRDEFNFGISDIDLYFIMSEEGLNIDIQKNYPMLNATFISKNNFTSDEGRKHRFICWSDGIKLYGQDMDLKKKDFPEPGTLLCLLLNRGCIDHLKNLKEEISSLNNPIDEILRGYTLKVAKIMLDFDFGVAMANKPYYTASRKQKIEYIKESWPEGGRVNLLEQLYYGKIVSQQDFNVLIDTYIENMEKNYQKLIEVEEKVNEEKT